MKIENRLYKNRRKKCFQCPISRSMVLTWCTVYYGIDQGIFPNIGTHAHVRTNAFFKIFSTPVFSAVGACTKKRDNTVITKLNISGSDLLICCEQCRCRPTCLSAHIAKMTSNARMRKDFILKYACIVVYGCKLS